MRATVPACPGTAALLAPGCGGADGPLRGAPRLVPAHVPDALVTAIEELYLPW